MPGLARSSTPVSSAATPKYTRGKRGRRYSKAPRVGDLETYETLKVVQLRLLAHQQGIPDANKCNKTRLVQLLNRNHTLVVAPTDVIPKVKDSTSPAVAPEEITKALPFPRQGDAAPHTPVDSDDTTVNILMEDTQSIPVEQSAEDMCPLCLNTLAFKHQNRIALRQRLIKHNFNDLLGEELTKHILRGLLENDNERPMKCPFCEVSKLAELPVGREQEVATDFLTKDLPLSNPGGAHSVVQSWWSLGVKDILENIPLGDPIEVDRLPPECVTSQFIKMELNEQTEEASEPKEWKERPNGASCDEPLPLQVDVRNFGYIHKQHVSRLVASGHTLENAVEACKACNMTCLFTAVKEMAENLEADILTQVTWNLCSVAAREEIDTEKMQRQRGRKEQLLHDDSALWEDHSEFMSKCSKFKAFRDYKGCAANRITVHKYLALQRVALKSYPVASPCWITCVNEGFFGLLRMLDMPCEALSCRHCRTIINLYAGVAAQITRRNTSRGHFTEPADLNGRTVARNSSWKGECAKQVDYDARDGSKKGAERRVRRLACRRSQEDEAVAATSQRPKPRHYRSQPYSQLLVHKIWEHNRSKDLVIYGFLAKYYDVLCEALYFSNIGQLSAPKLFLDTTRWQKSLLRRRRLIQDSLKRRFQNEDHSAVEKVYFQLNPNSLNTLTLRWHDHSSFGGGYEGFDVDGSNCPPASCGAITPGVLRCRRNSFCDTPCSEWRSIASYRKRRRKLKSPASSEGIVQLPFVRCRDLRSLESEEGGLIDAAASKGSRASNDEENEEDSELEILEVKFARNDGSFESIGGQPRPQLEGDMELAIKLSIETFKEEQKRSEGACGVSGEMSHSADLQTDGRRGDNTENNCCNVLHTIGGLNKLRSEEIWECGCDESPVLCSSAIGSDASQLSELSDGGIWVDEKSLSEYSELGDLEWNLERNTGIEGCGNVIEEQQRMIGKCVNGGRSEGGDVTRALASAGAENSTVIGTVFSQGGQRWASEELFIEGFGEKALQDREELQELVHMMAEDSPWQPWNPLNGRWASVSKVINAPLCEKWLEQFETEWNEISARDILVSAEDDNVAVICIEE